MIYPVLYIVVRIGDDILLFGSGDEDFRPKSSSKMYQVSSQIVLLKLSYVLPVHRFSEIDGVCPGRSLAVIIIWLIKIRGFYHTPHPAALVAR